MDTSTSVPRPTPNTSSMLQRLDRVLFEYVISVASVYINRPFCMSSVHVYTCITNSTETANGQNSSVFHVPYNLYIAFSIEKLREFTFS